MFPQPKVCSTTNVKKICFKTLECTFLFNSCIITIATTQVPVADPGPILAGVCVAIVGLALASYGFYALRLSKNKEVEPGSIC